ncbi:MAG: hypothetical protein COA69_04445 [Robiginitomaculum sp.]|nr:MAG: hypothetical protein COA69_04445 [Robiginitomaculum sp.]
MPARNYFVELRQDWIADMLHVYGYIGRVHLCRKFNISPQQATIDINLFNKARPNEMRYCLSKRRYIATTKELQA